MTCVEQSCPIPSTTLEFIKASDKSNHSAPLSDVMAPGDSHAYSCEVFGNELSGDVTITCSMGKIFTNASACAGPCYIGTNPNNNSEGFDPYFQFPDQIKQKPCATINEWYDGMINITCPEEFLLMDLSGCVMACAPSVSTNIITNTGSKDIL